LGAGFETSGGSPMRRALITGITGQDGRYLAEFLLNKGYLVYGLVRPTSNQTERIRHLLGIRHLLDRTSGIRLISGDLLDRDALTKALKEARPTEVYNLAAMSFVGDSFQHAAMTGEHTALGVARILEAVLEINPDIRFFQASSSEMFGKAQEVPQSESTPFHPRSPYGVAKLYGHWITVNYRESRGVFACSGILFNHESPWRGLDFVTRKISDGVARIKAGLEQRLVLGNLDAHRDWGFAGDYVEAMWAMLNPTEVNSKLADKPDDYVIATGVSHSVRDFVKAAFERVGIHDWERYVEVDKAFLRPLDVDQLVGDSSKAREKLRWAPRVSFEELVQMMVDHDQERLALPSK
jgi:GDPmannose 4,6-dehydratase